MIELSPGEFRFESPIVLQEGVILRGATPKKLNALDPGFDPPTRLEFPRIPPERPQARGFAGISIAPGASRCGVMHLALNRGQIDFRDPEPGRHRFVYGCLLRNAAAAQTEPAGSDPRAFVDRFAAAIRVNAVRGAYVANNRLPRSGEDDFLLQGYRLSDGEKSVTVDGLRFDHDNRPGILVNYHDAGGVAGSGVNGTPASHPHAFRKGSEIVGNWIYCTGRTAIAFAGNGTLCRGNTVRFEHEVWRPTVDGRNLSRGSNTNGNRAIEARGWRWQVIENDLEVFRNLAYDRHYRLNDGEGILHEDHMNASVRDVVLRGNRSNSPLMLYKTGPIRGAEIRDNEVTIPASRANRNAVFVSASRTDTRHPCREVVIAENRLAGDIFVDGAPASENVVRGNVATTSGCKIFNRAQAAVTDNEGFLERSSNASE